jgi:hypothetical protein
MVISLSLVLIQPIEALISTDRFVKVPLLQICLGFKSAQSAVFIALSKKLRAKNYKLETTFVNSKMANEPA